MCRRSQHESTMRTRKSARIVIRPRRLAPAVYVVHFFIFFIFFIFIIIAIIFLVVIRRFGI